ncbi:hypothetical protein [Haloarcula litorea]|uniref:hypothetical protein n=1 Tax=Haloarcula litorea TaxID=3032579 RepID=UPI0023E7D7B9|nr:hypothetical protein [Halomicroarcula sp. GDY20]
MQLGYIAVAHPHGPHPLAEPVDREVRVLGLAVVVEQSADGGGAIFGGGGNILTPMNALIGVLFLLGAFDPVKRKITG